MMNIATLNGELLEGIGLCAEIVEENSLRGEVNTPSGFGTNDHTELTKRDRPDQHPIESITNLRSELDNKLTGAGFLSNMDIQKILDL